MARSTIPDWPAMMRRATAAQYCDMTAAEFEGEVTAGRLPLPTKFGRDEKWSRRSIDEAIERRVGDVTPDWRSASNLYA